MRKSIDNLVKAIEMGVCTRSTKARLEELEAEEDKLKKDIERERVSTPTLTEEQLRFFLDKYAHLDVSVQQNREKIVDDLIGSIILYGDGRLIITFNYRNEPVETTLDEIIAAANHSADINCLASPKKGIPSGMPFFVPRVFSPARRDKVRTPCLARTKRRRSTVQARSSSDSRTVPCGDTEAPLPALPKKSVPTPPCG